ncbi:restriction endonuclease subunit S [Proteus mirabilis]|uniref:restriction endonuclease subunit S n=1 Tax=Proteus TaxID=583 RepID=UPI000F5CB89C|nr:MULTISPECIES: restriction endonuclease subunit S [Proteus]EKU0763295.1 restriction endonuclease subunit S [Proteus mirabilis]EKX9206953.1 restriction endonuclease subunit S [Proteus mirabilis]EMA4723709.1 restriction endonuclease subunit S [Proteus mirabilis]KAB7714972.1 restriction endonuclease subunit S [Proteus mirabilis]MBF8455073.1 restriction endonuclease subunit S [Proteus mirabilis]
MRQLSYLEKLLSGEEVEWRRLGNVARIKNGKDHKLLGEGMFPVYGSGGIMRYVDTYAYDKPSVLIPRKGSLGNLFFVDVPFWTVDTIFYTIIDEEQIRPKYFYYFLTTVGLGDMNQAGGVPSQTQAVLNELKIPIPCPTDPKKSLAIQSEIVRILDKFTAITAELTAELTARKKQYNYYRDRLLSFKEGEVEWKTLGDVTKKWYSGGTPTAGNPEYYVNGKIPWLRTQEVKFTDISATDVKITEAALKNSSAKWIPENCVIIAISGATAGRSAINKIPLTTNQHCGCLEIDSKKALYRYVFHWVSFNYESIKVLGQGARGDLNSTIIKNFKLPIPYATNPEKSLQEQAKIVAVLDKFDTLINSISEGLPREIELRQKQYEYYRDLLFSFSKSSKLI